MTEKALDKKIETLRALLGQDKDSELGLSKPTSPIDEIEPKLDERPEDIDNKGLSYESLDHDRLDRDSVDNNSLFDGSIISSIANSNNDETTETDTLIENQIKPLPTATKTFTPRDFIHFKKHSNEQSMILIKRYLSKHGKPRENSSELHALTNAISRIISNQQENDHKE